MNKQFKMNKLQTLLLLINCFCFGRLTTACETATTTEEKPVKKADNITPLNRNLNANLIVEVEDSPYKFFRKSTVDFVPSVKNYLF